MVGVGGVGGHPNKLVRGRKESNQSTRSRLPEELVNVSVAAKMVAH